MPGVSAILTAAGESTRMGSPKALLSWQGATLIEYQIRCLIESGVAEVVVVLGHRADEISPYVSGDRVRHVHNPDYRRGKATSVKCGVRAIDRDADAILLLAVDQPRNTDVISRVIRAHVENNPVITSPRFQGHGGHPLVFSATLKAELENISEENQGIREVFERHRDGVRELEIDDPILRLDLNTPEDYEEAKALYGA